MHTYTRVYIYTHTHTYILTHMHAHTIRTQMPEAVLQLENVIQLVWVGPGIGNIQPRVLQNRCRKNTCSISALGKIAPLQ